MREWGISLRVWGRTCRNMLIGIFNNCRNRLRQKFYENTKKSMSFFLYQRSFFYRFFKREPIQWHHSPKEDSASNSTVLSVSKKPFFPRVGQEYTVGPAGFRALCARKSGPSSKRARFLRRWRRIARFPFLGFPRTPFTRKGYAASVKRQSR